MGWILPQSLPKEQNLPTPGFWTMREILNYFGPPRLWLFVTVTRGNEQRLQIVSMTFFPLKTIYHEPFSIHLMHFNGTFLNCHSIHTKFTILTVQ